MKKSGFTFIEMLLVIIVVGTLAALSLGGFKYARDSHRVDSLIQELTLLRTAILSYKEAHGSLPEIAEADLSSDAFNALKPFWYPFHPENSKVIEGGRWVGKFESGAMNTFLALKKGNEYVDFDFELLKKKMQKLCCVGPDGVYFYILAPWVDWINVHDSGNGERPLLPQ